MILIKYATRNRYKWFMRAIANIHNTIHTKDFQILVSADIDDPTMNNLDVKNFCERWDNVKIVYGNSKSKIEAINADMDQADPSWDLLVNMSDDMCFMVDGWDSIIRQRIKDTWGDSTDCFVHFNDGYTKDALSSMSIIGKDYYKRDNYIYFPEYRSFSCDAEAYFVAKVRGRHKYFEEIIFRHQHPANTPVINDDLYAKNSLHTPHDTQLYWRRLHADFGMKEEGFTGPFPWDKYKTK